MVRRPLALALVVSVMLRACAASPPEFCDVVGASVPALDGEDDASRWRELEDAADEAIRDDVRALRVAAEQIARLGPAADFELVAALALRPKVIEAHRAVVAHTRRACG
jgi:hypothetical protein